MNDDHDALAVLKIRHEGMRMSSGGAATGSILAPGGIPVFATHTPGQAGLRQPKPCAKLGA